MNHNNVRFLRAATLAAAVSACGSGSTGPDLDEALVLVVSGIQHSCGLTQAGRAYCWGWNANGQLGDGTTDSKRVPVAVGGDITFTGIAAGGGHSCGVTAAGAVHCWGLNLTGQIGDGTQIDRHEPVLVSGSVQFASVIAGGTYTCGIATDGTPYCWGWNGEGQIGNGTNFNQSVPVEVGTGLTLTSMDASAFHTCGVTVAGEAHCWGRNNSGQLGNGGNAGSAVPALVSGGLVMTSIAVGDDHTCGLTGNGAVYCWGVNEFGQTASAGGAANSVPTAIVGGPATFSALFARADFTCGLDSAGAMYCWGLNDLGQHGVLSDEICTETDQLGVIIAQFGCSRTPVQMQSSLRFTSLAVGSHHVCGVSTTDGLAYCWGDSTEGQLGNGTAGSANSTVEPQLVLGQVAQ